MSKTRKRTKRSGNRRNTSIRMRCGVTLLFTLSVAAIAMMAVVNRLPIGNRYAYTEASDLWIVDDGDMQIAAPEVILFTVEPSPSPAPTRHIEITPTPSPSPSAEASEEASATPGVWSTATPEIPQTQDI